MKRIHLLVLLLTITVVGFSQQYQYGKAFDSTYYNPGWGDMDYAVPESPAFKILGTNPDNILHPTSAKAIALSIGDYFLTSGATIPKSLAVQFSPYLLANRNTSLKEYNKNGFQRFLSRLSLSVGTSVQGSAYSVAEGLNMTILDNTDLKSMTAYTNKLAQMARVDVDFRRQAIGAYTKAHTDLNAVQIMPLLDADSTHTSALSKAIDSLQQKLLDSAKTVDSLSLKTGVSDQQIVNFRDSVKQASWNNAIWQIGIATLQTSSDSLIKNLQFSQIAFWSSTGLPLGPKAQFLFGAKLGFVDSVKWYTNYSLGGRFFYGKNNTKVFLQGEFDHKDLVNSTTITAGCQFNISNGIWGQFAINLVINSSGKVSYQPGFNVGLANKEKKKQ